MTNPRFVRKDRSVRHDDHGGAVMFTPFRVAVFATGTTTNHTDNNPLMLMRREAEERYEQMGVK